MIRKLPSGGYRLYSRKKNPKTGKRRNLQNQGRRRKTRAGGTIFQARLGIPEGVKCILIRTDRWLRP